MGEPDDFLATSLTVRVSKQGTRSMN